MKKKYLFNPFRIKEVKNQQLQQENERLKEWKEDLLKENIELENIRKEAFEYITNTIIPYGDEWHWDDSSIRDYVVELLSILQNWK